jgi:probable addiction module antidote protein
MSVKMKIADLHEFDMAEHLPDDRAVAEYLSIVLEEDDDSALAQALGTIARARGMTQIARDAGIGREALYKALRAGASPRFDTIVKVLKALGVRLKAEPVNS